jgi:hypothetical protein
MKSRAIFFLFATLMLLAFRSFVEAQTEQRKFTEAIEDNSFFIEEAYNQEDGIIQHISTMTYFSKPSENVVYSFTEEWPFLSQTHQVGFTVPFSWIDGNSAHGFGDILFNYRYQLLDSDDWVACAPRLSLIIPTGDDEKGLGSGVVGVQFNLPASKRISDLFVVHANAGATVLPNVKATTASGGEVKRTLTSFNLGASGIALATYSLNLMLEVNFNFMSEIDGTGEVARATETILSPGFRYAIDVGSLQIVPGVAVPMSFIDDEQRTGVFFYLSFEHPI